MDRKGIHIVRKTIKILSVATRPESLGVFEDRRLLKAEGYKELEGLMAYRSEGSEGLRAHRSKAIEGLGLHVAQGPLGLKLLRLQINPQSLRV